MLPSCADRGNGIHQTADRNVLDLDTLMRQHLIDEVFVFPRDGRDTHDVSRDPAARHGQGIRMQRKHLLLWIRRRGREAAIVMRPFLRC